MSVPVWSWIAIGLGSVLLLAGLAVGAVLWWRWLGRSRLIRLIGIRVARGLVQVA